MAGKLNLNFGVIGWCRQDSQAGENSNLIFPPWHKRFFGGFLRKIRLYNLDTTSDFFRAELKI